LPLLSLIVTCVGDGFGFLIVLASGSKESLLPFASTLSSLVVALSAGFFSAFIVLSATLQSQCGQSDSQTQS